MINQISKLILMSLMALSLTACFHDEDDGGDVHGDTILTATVINSGADTGTVNSGTDIDMFSVFCANTCTIVASTGGTTDTVGRILNGAGTVVAQDDDSGVSIGVTGSFAANFLVSASSQPAGQYFVEVTGFTSSGGVSSTGAYTLVVTAQ